MLTEILVEALTNMDYDTLEHVLESCSEEELAFVDEAMEMTKADFKAENVNTFKRNDYLKSFKLDNGTGIGSKTFDRIKGIANNHFGKYTLDNPMHVNELRVDIHNIANNTVKNAMNAGISPDVADKIATRTAAEYLKEARKASRQSINDKYGEKVYKNMTDIENTFDDQDAYKKLEKSYIAWAKRENAKLNEKYNISQAKKKLLKKLSKLKPSDIK